MTPPRNESDRIGLPWTTLVAAVRRIPPILLSLALILSMGCSEHGTPEYAGGRPNVVLIVVDTLRGDCLSGPLKKRHKVQTPALDALAADGVLFERAFSHAPITLPSHTALFSSRLPFETGVMNNGQPVRDDLPLIAEWLSEYGYATRAVISLGTLNLGGKSHVGRGFDEFDKSFFRISTGPKIVERVIPQLDGVKGRQPFFLFAHFSDPHEPYNAHGSGQSRTAQVFLDGELLEEVTTSDMTLWNRELELGPGEHEIEVRSEHQFRIRALQGKDSRGRDLESRWVLGERLDSVNDAKWVMVQGDDETRTCFLRLWISDHPDLDEKKLRYRKEVEFVDGAVGELLDELKRRGLYDDSLIVFTSDHGEALGDRGSHVGHIHTVYDEQIHVPLIIKLPRGDRRLEALEDHRESLAPLIDVVPTILALIGVPELPGQRGRSLLEGGSGLVVAQTHRPQAQNDVLCLRDERYKMIFVADEERFEMYDMQADPEERNDVYATAADERPSWAQSLREFARISAAGGLDLKDLDSATRADLEALGYGGGGDSDESK